MFLQIQLSQEFNLSPSYHVSSTKTQMKIEYDSVNIFPTAFIKNLRLAFKSALLTSLFPLKGPGLQTLTRGWIANFLSCPMRTSSGEMADFGYFRMVISG